MESHVNPSELQELSSFAQTIAKEAGAVAMAHFRTRMHIDIKADSSPVTRADRSSEALIRRRVSAAYPDHGIYGEEEGAQNAGRAHVWVIDPIDGTASFITGMPTFGTLIAHLVDGRPVVGVIHIPPTGETWRAEAGTGARFGADPCRTSGCARLEEARLYTTSPDIFDAPGWAAFERVSRAAAMRRFGGDCYAYGLLASGHVDAVVEMGLQPYDFLALVPVIEGAGGVITDWQGAPLGLGSTGRVVAAASARLHAEILARLAG